MRAEETWPVWQRWSLVASASLTLFVAFKLLSLFVIPAHLVLGMFLCVHPLGVLVGGRWFRRSVTRGSHVYARRRSGARCRRPAPRSAPRLRIAAAVALPSSTICAAAPRACCDHLRFLRLGRLDLVGEQLEADLLEPRLLHVDLGRAPSRPAPGPAPRYSAISAPLRGLRVDDAPLRLGPRHRDLGVDLRRSPGSAGSAAAFCCDSAWFSASAIRDRSRSSADCWRPIESR